MEGYKIGLLGAGLLGLVVWWRKRMNGETSTGPSPNFDWSDFEVSVKADELGLDNTLTSNARKWLRVLAQEILEPAKSAFPPGLLVNSAFRSPEVNAAIEGSTTSQHMALGEGAAVDVQPLEGDRYELAAWLYANRASLPIDQMIVYRDRSHVHVSTAAPGSNRGQFLEHNAGQYASWTP